MIEVRVRVNSKALQEIRTKIGSLNTSSQHPAFQAMGLQWANRYSGFIRKRFSTYSKGGGDWAPLAESTIQSRLIGKKTKGTIGQLERKARARLVKARNSHIDRNISIRSRLARQLQSSARRQNRSSSAHAEYVSNLHKKERSRNYIRLAKINVAKSNSRYEKSRKRAEKSLGRAAAARAKVAILINTGTLFGALTVGANGNVVRQIPGGVRYGIQGGKGSRGTATLGQIAKWHHEGSGRLPKRKILDQPDPATVKAMEADLRKAVNAIIAESKGSAGGSPNG